MKDNAPVYKFFDYTYNGETKEVERKEGSWWDSKFKVKDGEPVKREMTGQAMTGAALTAASTIGGLIDASDGDRPNAGAESLQMAAQLGSAGATFGPWGAAIGAGVGAIYGGVTGAQKEKEYDKMESRRKAQERLEEEELGRAIYWNNRKQNMF